MNTHSLYKSILHTSCILTVMRNTEIVSSFVVKHFSLAVVKTVLPKQNLSFVSFHLQRQIELISFLSQPDHKVLLYILQPSVIHVLVLFQWLLTNCTVSLLMNLYMHNNSGIFISNSNILTQICTCIWITLQMEASMKDTWNSMFFLFHVSESHHINMHS